jgi:hypothetical protein
LFAKYIPSQPTTAELKKMFPEFMGSYAGLMRGGMEAETGCKRKSPLFVKSADTILPDDKKTLITVEQGTSSKPKETDLVSTSKKKEDGERASDTSMFTFDTAGERKQKFEAIISVEELQKISLADKSGVVPKGSRDAFIAALGHTFTALGADPTVAIVKTKPLHAVFAASEEGIILSQKQMAAMVIETMSLIYELEITRASAHLEIDKDSLQVEVTDEASPLAPVKMSAAEFVDGVKSGKIGFSEFFKAA